MTEFISVFGKGRNNIDQIITQTYLIMKMLLLLLGVVYCQPIVAQLNRIAQTIQKQAFQKPIRKTNT